MTRRGVFLINDTSVSGHPGCVTVMAVICRQLEVRGLSVSGRWPMGAEPQLGLAMAPALRQAAAIIVNGEGTLHNTLTRPGARRLLQSIKRAHAASPAPIFLLNATIENLRAKDFDVLRLCRGLFLRDSDSCRYAASHGVAASFVPDLCFAASMPVAAAQERLILTDSALPEVSARLKQRSEAIGARYLPMQPSRLRSLMHWAVTPRLHEDRAARYRALVAAAESLVTGRFHAAVFALLAGTPFVAVASNTAKIQSLLMDATGDASRVISPAMLQQDQLAVRPFSAGELGLIRDYRTMAIRSARAMFDHIAQAAATPSARVA